jgi:phosphatidylglycerophosphatase A
VWRIPGALFWARLGWIGKSPVAPGTMATALAGIPCAWVLAVLPMPAAMSIIILLFVVGCRVAGEAEQQLQQHDPGEVVIDELIGYLVTMIGFPVSVKSFLIGFLAFRVFDIFKPWPVKTLGETIKGGAGVVMDDVGAGLYAHALVWLALKLWP